MSATILATPITHNRQRRPADCLTALLGRIRPPDRITPIDNASTDGVPE